MFQIIDINEDNLELYSAYLGEDLAENIGRSYYRGLVAVGDDGPQSGMVWLLKHLDQEADTESNIIWVRSEDNGAFDEMMEAYSERARSEDVVRSHVFIPVKGGKEKKTMLIKKGFDMRLSESDVVVVKLSELSEMPLMKKLKKAPIPDSIAPLNSLTLRTFRKGVSKCVMNGKYGLCEDLSELGIYWFEDEVSCVSSDDNGINGFFLFHLRPSGVMAVQLLVCLDNTFKTTLPFMMRQFVTAMEEKYGPDTLVELDRHNEQSLLLTEKLLPRGFGIPIYAGGRNE
jgi:hypothetical protein